MLRIYSTVIEVLRMLRPVIVAASRRVQAGVITISAPASRLWASWKEAMKEGERYIDEELKVLRLRHRDPESNR
jgi:hypothetical protein